MRAFVRPSRGAVEVLEIREPAESAPGEGQVATRAATAVVNHVDAIMVAGNCRTKPPLPSVTGPKVATEVGVLAHRIGAPQRQNDTGTRKKTPTSHTQPRKPCPCTEIPM